MTSLAARRWTLLPWAAIFVLLLSWGKAPSGLAAVPIIAFLAGAVLSAVQHAEVLAHRVGEPFGSLILAVAVTAIEVGLIVTLTLGGHGKESLARDTVFAAVIISTNGIVGAALLAATLRGGVAVFNAEGAGAMLASVTSVAVLSLVMPDFTASSPGPTFAPGQLLFAAVASLGLYLLFVFVQVVRHREQFEPVATAGGAGEGHGERPSVNAALRSFGLLITALVAVVGLAKVISPAMEAAVEELGLPVAVVGVVIALLVLLPEGITAVRAAASDYGDVQRSFNLAYGSAMASIGLTIPVVALISIAFDSPIVLGLDPVHVVLLALTVGVSVLTVTPGRATLLNAGVHLNIFAAFLVITIMP